MDHLEILKTTCRDAVLAVFPDICPEFLLKASEEKDHDYEQIITHILDQSEDGQSYPKRQRVNLKRKRTEDDSDEAADNARRFDNENRRREQKNLTYIKTSKTLLQQCFPLVSVKDLYMKLSQNDECLYPTILAMDKILSDWDDQNPPFKLKSRPMKAIGCYSEEAIEETIRTCNDPAEKEALVEFHEARKAQAIRKARADAILRNDKAEVDNFNRAQAEGTVSSCECCYDDFALNRMVHCTAEKCHFFCYNCARQMAENEIGLSKYELVCMSMDGCDAGFSNDQRELFLDKNSAIALERIEQEAMLRLAGIDNLETCPFCPFAAEYPPVEIDKEFRCQNPECEYVSCRLCRQETHIPKSCAEVRLENGHSARREIEEAMSAALIRTCNKCGTPFIKENGCNKMTCTRAGCNNIQCYVCSKSCDYRHFDDLVRGGKAGNCPLFDSVEKRHEDEVRAAEQAARKKVAEENPDVDDQLLQINFGRKVKSTIREDRLRNQVEMQRLAMNGMPPGRMGIGFEAIPEHPADAVQPPKPPAPIHPAVRPEFLMPLRGFPAPLLGDPVPARLAIPPMQMVGPALRRRTRARGPPDRPANLQQEHPENHHMPMPIHMPPPPPRPRPAELPSMPAPPQPAPHQRARDHDEVQAISGPDDAGIKRTIEYDEDMDDVVVAAWEEHAAAVAAVRAQRGGAMPEDYARRRHGNHMHLDNAMAQYEYRQAHDAIEQDVGDVAVRPRLILAPRMRFHRDRRHPRD